MTAPSQNLKPPPAPSRLLAAAVAALLSACGGGDLPSSADPQWVGEVASATTVLELTADSSTESWAQASVRPSFQLAPVLLDVPDDADATSMSLSAQRAPRRQLVPTEFRARTGRGLSLPNLQDSREQGLAGIADEPVDAVVSPQAAGSAVSTYTPAQIRAAYGLPALPSRLTGLTATQAAQLGAGQTIYIVDAMHDPNAVAELAAFNQKFGLPLCATKAIASNATLPLAAASNTSCELSVVYSTAAGGMTTAAPSYDSGWATEIALDVQWAHATAPLARIVLIEAPDATLNSLLGAIRLANAMGPGVVSMSFGAREGNWTASVDSAFTGPGMSYLAATGDNGAAVEWPSVSPNVLAVGGTSLTYSGAGPRSEISWSGTGGGVSAYTPTPNYQTSAVPGMGTLARRSVADVAFNADPKTGQYVAVLAPGASTPSWVSAGGTSLSTPQWAGIVAIANATRAQAAKQKLGAPHSVLYGQIATTASLYSASFADVKTGSDGTCAACTAKVGYDPLSGLGTPNVSSLLSALSGASVAAPAPVVTAATVNGVVGTALSFTVSTTATNALSYTLVGAPSGMSINNAGGVTWATPVQGSYKLTVVAKDTTTGLTGQASYTVNIAAKPVTVSGAPVVTAASISGRPAAALSFSVAVNSANPVSFSLSGAPSGMSISNTGVVNWASPVLGSYSVTVTAKDSKTGLSGSGVLTVKITAAGPVITAAPIVGVAGKAVSTVISITDPGATSISVAISGAPMGMTFAISALKITATWANPITGSYSLQVSVSDNAGLSSKASVPITITAK